MTFALTPASAPVVQGLPGGWLQVRDDGTDLGEPDVAVIDFVGDPEVIQVTRGVGENSHVITVRVNEIVVPPPQLEWLAYWNATEVDTSGGNIVIHDDSGNGIDLSTSLTSPQIIVAAAGVNGNSIFLPAYYNPHFFTQSLNTKTTDPRLNFGNEPFTIGRWVKLEAPFQSDTTARMLLGRFHTGPGGAFNDMAYMLSYNRAANTFGWGMSSNGTAGSAHSVSKSAGTETNWHLVIGAYDGTTLYLWVDAGVPVTTAHAGGAFAAADAYFSFDYRFGSTGGDNDTSAKVTVNSYFMSGFVLPRMITQDEVEFLTVSGRLMFDETQLPAIP